jgi:glycosyltransferase involved in cell wall biosynthesis
MRVVFPTPEFVTEPANYDGGLATYLSRVAPALLELGHEPVVLVAAGEAGQFRWNGVTVERVRVASRFVQAADRATFRRFWPVLRWGWQGRQLARAAESWCRGRSDVMVQYPNYTAPARWHRGDAPAVVRLSSYQPLWRAAHGHGSADGVARQIERLEQESMAKAHALFAPSRLIADIVSDKTGREVEVIPSPFVPELGAGAAESVRPWGNAPYFLFFGSLSPMKGVDVIARMLEALLQSHADWHFVFAGRDLGPAGQPLWPRIQTAAGAAAARVHYLGRLERGVLSVIVKKAALVVLPSRVDNLPNTVLEAMGAGRVVVGTRRSSIDELITDGRDGFLCEPADPISLRNAIDRALALPRETLDAMGAAARRRVEDLRPEVTVGRLVEFYRRLLPRNG